MHVCYVYIYICNCHAFSYLHIHLHTWLRERIHKYMPVPLYAARQDQEDPWH